MKTLRSLLAIALAYGLSGVAKADDFQMVVVDPPPPPAATFPIYDIIALGSPVSAYFGACQPGELPLNSPSYDGCIALLNGTGVVLNSLQITVPDIGGVLGQTAGCPIDPNDIFPVSGISCAPNPVGGTFLLNFTGGNISPNFPLDNFVIAEDGVPFASFPAISVVAANTPEPRSIWLLFTGVLSVGWFGVYRRRHALCELRP
jgi:hypothetical protein